MQEFLIVIILYLLNLPNGFHIYLFFLISFYYFLDNLKKTAKQDHCPDAIQASSTPREPVSCQKQWTQKATTAAISLLTTCRPMDKTSDRCFMNQLNEFESDVTCDNTKSDLNNLKDNDSDLKITKPKPLKRHSILESRSVNGLFRLSAAKDAIEKVTRKVMNNDSKNDLKSEIESDIKSDYLNPLDKLDHLKSDHIKSVEKYPTNHLIQTFENLKNNDHHESNEVIKDNYLNKSNSPLREEELSLEDINEELNRIMPEPLFTDLELDELCNRSLNSSLNSSNLSNSSIDCNQTIIEIRNQSNLVLGKLNEEINSLKSKDLDSVDKNLDNQDSIKELDKEPKNDNQQVDLKKDKEHETILKDKIDLNTKIDQFNPKQSNRNEVKAKDRIDQLINNRLKNKNSVLNRIQNDQFNFEQQTDNLVEEMYFSAELSDQQKSIQTVLKKVADDQQQNSLTDSLSSKTSSVSITKIQVYSQTTSKPKLNDDQFELKSNSSVESLSKFPEDDGVEMSKIDEEEENNKFESEDVCCKSSVK